MKAVRKGLSLQRSPARMGRAPAGVAIYSVSDRRPSAQQNLACLRTNHRAGDTNINSGSRRGIPNCYPITAVLRDQHLR
ncbi:hypothetical protein E2C01_083515 [Portunus trituberculatus]|uniref:Uncharacterized protein n=1 Tax=Portunus trituberculatus TaxID=210409 RepID=A0A5B7IVD9_PORTR|nr:hypothetical protein [Portunus trituberculatus]